MGNNGGKGIGDRGCVSCVETRTYTPIDTTGASNYNYTTHNTTTAPKPEVAKPKVCVALPAPCSLLVHMGHG